MSTETPTIEANVRGPAGKGRSGIAVRTPFSQGFIDALKKAVPSDDREFRPGTGIWWVAVKHSRTIEQLVLRFFPEFMRSGGKEDGHVVTRGGVVAVQGRLL